MPEQPPTSSDFVGSAEDSSASRAESVSSDHEELDLLASGRMLGLGRKRLIRWGKEGRLPGRRDGFEWYFTRNALLEFARQNCLECGKPHQEIEPDIYFCLACGSSFAPYCMETEVAWFSPMTQTHQQLFMQRLIAADTPEQEAISQLQQRYTMSRLLAYQLWYQFVHNIKGTHRVGLGDPLLDPWSTSETSST